MGMPVIADELYGAIKKVNKIASVNQREIVRRFPRFALHAAELGFTHPISGQSLLFKVDWPDSMKALLKELNLIK